jgi:hypothetical protein
MITGGHQTGPQLHRADPGQGSCPRWCMSGTSTRSRGYGAGRVLPRCECWSGPGGQPTGAGEVRGARRGEPEPPRRGGRRRGRRRAGPARQDRPGRGRRARHHLLLRPEDKFWVTGAPGGERWEIYTVLQDSVTSGARTTNSAAAARRPPAQPEMRSPAFAAHDQAGTVTGKRTAEQAPGCRSAISWCPGAPGRPARSAGRPRRRPGSARASGHAARTHRRTSCRWPRRPPAAAG